MLLKICDLRVFRFIISGGLSTLSHWTMMWILVYASVIPEVASSIGAILGAVINYYLQREFAFKSIRKHKSTIPRYFIVCVIIWVSNLFIFFTLFRILNVEIIASQLLATALVALLSYWLFNKNVFNE